MICSFTIHGPYFVLCGDVQGRHLPTSELWKRLCHALLDVPADMPTPAGGWKTFFRVRILSIYLIGCIDYCCTSPLTPLSSQETAQKRENEHKDAVAKAAKKLHLAMEKEQKGPLLSPLSFMLHFRGVACIQVSISIMYTLVTGVHTAKVTSSTDAILRGTNSFFV